MGIIITNDLKTDMYPNAIKLTLDCGDKPEIKLWDGVGKSVATHAIRNTNILRIEVLRGITVCRIHKGNA